MHSQFRISKHAAKRMDLRGRNLEDIRQVILSGEVIREYPDEKPYPEYLFLGYPSERDDPCYVVIASNDETIIVTVHDYDPELYEQTTARGGSNNEMRFLQKRADPLSARYRRTAQPSRRASRCDS